jgi:hypothetical protein
MGHSNFTPPPVSSVQVCVLWGMAACTCFVSVVGVGSGADLHNARDSVRGPCTDVSDPRRWIVGAFATPYRVPTFHGNCVRPSHLMHHVYSLSVVWMLQAHLPTDGSVLLAVSGDNFGLSRADVTPILAAVPSNRVGVAPASPPYVYADGALGKVRRRCVHVLAMSSSYRRDVGAFPTS